MEKVIMIGCDLHEETLVNMIGIGRGEPIAQKARNTAAGRRGMMREWKALARQHGAKRIVLVYEACCLGFGLYDELTGAGVECHVLAPSKLPSSPKDRRNKTDTRDARRLLDILRGHVLAGNALPSIWVPDPQRRQDRELVRRRLDVAQRAAQAKTRIQMLLKRYGLRRPKNCDSWSVPHRRWLEALSQASDPLPLAAAAVLGSHLRELCGLEEEVAAMDAAVEALAATERYAAPVAALTARQGVGTLTAMVFLTEMGDLSRFSNRRQVAAYLGLAPSSHNSGKTQNRHGHITRQGPSRVRMALCQAVWSMLRHSDAARVRHRRIAGGKDKGKKIATVAMMRQLGVGLWHAGLEAQQRAADPPEDLGARVRPRRTGGRAAAHVRRAV